jgi:hypothetical protein
MNVINGFPNVFGRPEIAIIAAAALPESNRAASIRLPIRQPVKKSRSFTIKKENGSLGNRLFEGREHTADLIRWGLREQQHVDMFGHDDEGPKMKLVAAAS